MRALAILLLALPVAAADIHSSLAIVAGQKSLDSDDWGSADTQTVFGLEAVAWSPGFPVGLDFGWTLGSGDGTESGIGLDVSAFEAHVAPVWVGKPHEKVFAYAGLGLQYLSASVDFSDSIGTFATVDDSGFGWWIGAGAQYLFTERFGLGAQISHSSVELEDSVLGIDFSADGGGTVFAVLLGFHW